MQNKSSLMLRHEAVPKATDLPQPAIQIIFSFCTRQEKACFALTHPSFADSARAVVTDWYVEASSLAVMGKLGAHFEKFSYPNMDYLTVDIQFGDTMAVSYLPEISKSCQHLEIYFTVPPTSESLLRSLGRPAAFSQVTSLEFSGQNDPERRLNMNGELKALSGMSNLRDLTLRRLGSDANLHKLTHLTSLHIEFPSHEFTPPAHLLCDNCNLIHLEDSEDYECFIDELPWQHKAAFGSGIGELPLLEHLTLDFAVPADDGIGANAMLNRFIVNVKDYSFDNDAPEPTEDPGWFKKVKTVTFLNVGGGDHFLSRYSFREYMSTKFTGVPGARVFGEVATGGISNYMPAVELIKVEIHLENVSAGPGAKLIVQFDTDEGEVTTLSKLTEEDGILFVNMRPSENKGLRLVNDDWSSLNSTGAATV